MTCVRPVSGHWGPGGRVYFDGRGWRDRPVTVRCGKCPGCRSDRAQQWALRCQHEAQMHERNSFVTLTYSPQQLPVDGSLDVSHFQSFARATRKKLGPFRYFHCGEYGEENLRPHYHAILFGLDFKEDRSLVRDGPHPLYTSPTLERLWSRGFVTVGDVSFQSAAYVARYCLKKLSAKSARYARVDPQTGEQWYVKPEYCTMSRRPGIGARWIEKFFSDVFPSDEVVFDGRRYRPPRYYESRLDPVELDRLKAARAKFALEHPDRSHPDRLEALEYILSNNTNKNRSL